MRRVFPALATVAVVMLAGCAAEGPTSGTVTIADTKSSVQLFRNTVSSEVNPNYIAEVRDVTDRSETCQDDPESKMRLWRSESVIELLSEHSEKADLIRESITDTFTEKGWRKEVVTGENETVVSLINPRSLATIELTVTDADEFTGAGATFYIDIAGPCVPTAGPGSEELRRIGG